MSKPRLFVIGDSISIDYGPYVHRQIMHVISYNRKGGVPEEGHIDINDPEANGGDSGMVLGYLQSCIETGMQADWIMVNCGLHDIKRIRENGGEIAVPLERYKQNLAQIFSIAAASGMKSIWVTCTPFDQNHHNTSHPEFDRMEADLTAYNAAACEVAAAAGATMIDLHLFTRNLTGDLYRDHVHFTDEVVRQQAAFIAGQLLRLLTP